MRALPQSFCAMHLTPEQKRLEQIFHPYAAQQQATAFDLQTRFVHYTRAETAMNT